MGALLPLITALISAAPGAVNLIMGLVHPDGSTTIQILAAADANDAAAMTAIAQLQASVQAKNATAKMQAAVQAKNATAKK